MVKHFRERKGWSQQQLCDVSGVSVRVVSKAEAGESVSRSSIDHLATAFSTAERKVFPEDLISYPLELARIFVDALHVDQQNIFDSIGGMVDPEATFRIAGNPKKIPFAGVHRGPRAYRRALRKFFQIFEISSDFGHTNAYEYFSKGTEVVVWGKSRLRLVGSNSQPEEVEFRKRLRFRRGLLYSFEDHYDIGKGAINVANAADVQGSDIYDPLEDSSIW